MHRSKRTRHTAPVYAQLHARRIPAREHAYALVPIRAALVADLDGAFSRWQHKDGARLARKDRAYSIAAARVLYGVIQDFHGCQTSTEAKRGSKAPQKPRLPLGQGRVHV